MISQFTSEPSMAPKIFNWYNAASYPSLWGQTFLDEITFAKFGKYCTSGARGGVVDAALSGIPPRDGAADAWHPVITTNIELVQVDPKARVFLNPPDPAWINHEDCIDMDCDGPKVRMMIC